MRRWLPILLLLVAVVTPVPAQAATSHRVEAGMVFIHNKVKGYVIGTLRAGDVFDVERRTDKDRWAYGRVISGGFGIWGLARCGWVRTGGLRSVDNDTPTLCPGDPGLLAEKNIFKRRSYIPRDRTGAVRPTILVPCASTRAFGNYNPANGQFETPYGLMPVGRGPEVRGFGLRHISKDGRAGLVRDRSNPAGAPGWFFVQSGCLLRAPVHVGEGEGGFPEASKRVRPRRVDPFRDVGLRRLRWKRFGALRATARGIARVNTCMPTCANGMVERRRGARLTLSRPRLGSCNGKRRFYYTRWHARWPNGLDLPSSSSGELLARC